MGDDKGHSKLSKTDFAIAGGGSGFITRMICQPLDVLKIRFQLQVEPITKHVLSKYQSMLHATDLIIREEGAKALWKGHVPAQLLSISYGVVQFWTFEVLTKEVSPLRLSSNLSPIINFSSGTVAGGAATVVSFPFDVVRTRLVAQSEKHIIYPGIYDAFKQIIRQEGFFALYKGLWPTIVQVAPQTGVQFMCYKIFDNLYRKLFHSDNVTLSSSLVAGSLSGLCAKTAIYPLDLIKKRLQVQGFEHGRMVFGQTFRCKSLTDCFVRIYQAEGFPGFFKGLAPSLVKAVFTTALHFSSYEMICKFLEHKK